MVDSTTELGFGAAGKKDFRSLPDFGSLAGRGHSGVSVDCGRGKATLRPYTYKHGHGPLNHKPPRSWPIAIGTKDFRSLKDFGSLAGRGHGGASVDCGRGKARLRPYTDAHGHGPLNHKPPQSWPIAIGTKDFRSLKDFGSLAGRGHGGASVDCGRGKATLRPYTGSPWNTDPLKPQTTSKLAYSYRHKRLPKS